jgi:4-aminobutyrate aminotransferase-like enzyme
LGAQQAGGMPAQKDWIVNQDPAIVQAPFPDGYWTQNTSFDLFLETLQRKGLAPASVAGVIFETYQGAGPDFAPKEYIQRLAQWCEKNDVVFILDEVQSGFGRTGKFWAFEHYGVTPDVICCGKGISSSLPLSAVIGRAEIMDQFPPGSMTSTHTGNPVCAAAALASLKKIVHDDLAGNAARMGVVLEGGLAGLRQRHTGVIGHYSARGLVGGLQMVRPGTKEPDAALAHDVVERCFHKGLLFFAPVGAWGQTVKIAPPLTITEEPLREGLAVLGDVMDEVCAARRKNP